MRQGSVLSLLERGLQILNQTIHLRLGEERPARHHRVELSARLVLTVGDCQRDLFRYAAPVRVSGERLA